MAKQAPQLPAYMPAPPLGSFAMVPGGGGGGGKKKGGGGGALSKGGGEAAADGAAVVGVRLAQLAAEEVAGRKLGVVLAAAGVVSGLFFKTRSFGGTVSRAAAACGEVDLADTLFEAGKSFVTGKDASKESAKHSDGTVSATIR